MFLYTHDLLFKIYFTTTFQYLSTENGIAKVGKSEV